MSAATGEPALRDVKRGALLGVLLTLAVCRGHQVASCTARQERIDDLEQLVSYRLG